MIASPKVPLQATTYEVIGLNHPSCPNDPIKIELTWHRDHPLAGYHGDAVPKAWKQMWAIRLNGIVLGRGGDWEWEPSPSHRSDAYIRRTRFPTAQAALRFLISASAAAR